MLNTSPFHSAYPRLAFILPFAALLSLSGCEVHDPHDHNDQEVISTVVLRYVSTADTSVKSEAIIKFKEGFHQGAGGLERNDTLKLKAATAYSANLVLLDETKNPAADMSAEVEEEGDEHQIFYAPSGGLLTVTYADKDGNNRPIGLKTAQATGSAGTGTLKVTLKHMPGVKSDNSTVTTGETDVEVTFNVKVE
jgi:hypothetical protein